MIVVTTGFCAALMVHEAAVITDELVARLSGTDPFTVVGPNDTVMPDTMLKSTSDTDLLKYHVRPGKYRAADLAACQLLPKVNDKKSIITKSAAGSVTLNDSTHTASVVAADLSETNGVVNSIDKVLTVPSNSCSLARTVVDVVLASAAHTDLATVVVTNELVATLSATGPCTVVSPNNTVMLDDLAKNTVSAGLLTDHVISGKILAVDLAACPVVTIVKGKELEVNKNAAGSVKLNDGTSTVSVHVEDLAIAIAIAIVVAGFFGAW